MASPQQLSGRQFQLLVKPKIVWVVQSGVVSVYAVALTAGLPTGRRQFLFEVHQGEWLFGAECQGAHITYGLMLMASDRHATLVSLPFEQASDELDAVQLNTWLNHIAPYVESVELDEVRRQLQPKSISEKGTSTLNQEALTPCARLTQQLLTRIRQRAELKHVEKISQLQQQERIYRQSLQEGLVSLAQVLTPDYLPVAQTEEDEVLRVMGSIGRHLNVEIVPPKNQDRSDRSYTLEAIARSSGLRMRPVKLSANWWKDNCGTLVGSCGNGRPIALLPTSVNRYTVYDPRQSQRKALTAEVANTLETDAWQVYRPFPDSPLSSGEMLRFVLRGRSRDVVMVLVMSLAASILGWLTPIITGELIEQVIPNAEVNYLMQLGLLMIGASIGAGIFQLTRGFMLVRLSMITDMETQAAVWDRVLKLPAIFFRDFTSGDLLQRINSITEIQKTLSATTLSQLLSGLFLASNLILMFWYSPRLALGAIAISLVLVFGIVVAGLQDIRQNRVKLELYRRLYGTVVQLIDGVAKLRISGAESRAFIYWANQYQDFMRSSLIVKAIQDNLNVFITALIPMGTALIFWLTVAPALNLDHTTAPLKLGSYIAFNTAFGAFTVGVYSVSSTLMQSLLALNLWEQAQPILLAQPESVVTKTDPGILTGRVSLEEVSFRYYPQQEPVLNHISLHAEPGEFIAFVGPSGSGKSTLLRLLLGFETPEAGVIYYDSCDVSQVNLQVLRRQLGVVLQDSQIMPGSIFENIAGCSSITEEDAWMAAHMAGLHQTITEMPMQLQTIISEGGSNLSGGQRQQLLIARALAQKPKILLFDEATSALDNQSQAVVDNSLVSLNVTRIVIAHRLSTIKDADRIYVIEKGIIVQNGSFQSLSQQPGLFARLIARQMA